MALPAGEYRVQKVAYDSSVLLIQRTDHAAATVVTSFAAQANAKQAQSKLLFHRYRNRYFLSQIWTAGSARGSERSEEHTSELQSRLHLVCRLLLEKKKLQHVAAAAIHQAYVTNRTFSSSSYRSVSDLEGWSH